MCDANATGEDTPKGLANGTGPTVKKSPSTSRGGSPLFNVIEKSTGRRFLAQRKPMDKDLNREIQIHNMLRNSPDLAQLHQVLADEQRGEAVLVYENADRSFIDSLLPPPSPRRSPLPEAAATAASGSSTALVGTQCTREAQVQVFVKQLLTALQYMHRRGIAHLDLRPEVILLQDDHLRLADFGQSRRLINGKLMQGGSVKTNPEFVSPEIVGGGRIELSSDMWSVGALTYVLLVGRSPFLGDNDDETLQNVMNGEWTLLEGAQGISETAMDFLRNLLVKNTIRRMDVEQALQHEWLSDPELGDTKLSTDCLREFKYQHKWLERRVFVQQTPSEQLTQMMSGPKQALCATSEESTAAKQGGEPSRAEPYAIYDYLRIKEESKPEGARRTVPYNEHDAVVGRTRRAAPPPHGGSPFSTKPSVGGNCPPGYQPPPIPPRRSGSADSALDSAAKAPPVPDWIVRQLPPGVKPDDLVWDPRYGGGFYLPPHLQPKGPPPQQHVGGPPRSRSSGSLERGQPGVPPSGASSVGPPSLAPLPDKIAKKIEAMATAAAKQNAKEMEQNAKQTSEVAKTDQHQQQQLIGEEADLVKQLKLAELKLEDLKNPQSALMKLIRGERRQIQEELANRVLSDISEESSIRSTAADEQQHPESRDEHEKQDFGKQRLSKLEALGTSKEEEMSTTTTAEHDGPSSSTATPLASPAFTAESPQHQQQQFFADDEASPPEVLDEREQQFSSRHLPLNVPAFREAAPFPNGTALDPPEVAQAALGLKSGKRSPCEEHTISVQISGRAALLQRQDELSERVEPPEAAIALPADIDREQTPVADEQPPTAAETGPPVIPPNGLKPMDEHKQRKPIPDTEFDLLMDAVERIKQDNAKQRQPKKRQYRGEDLDELEKYRPQDSACREFELEVQRQKQPLYEQDFAWESRYQIGPDTLLIPTCGARFNARVRDYRRELWGDSAPYVTLGMLGFRNQEVTVRERRRYTDLIREDQQIAKSVDTVTEGLLQQHEGAQRRIQGDENGQIKAENGKNGSVKKYSPVFRDRLRDAYFCDGAATAVMECHPVGNPTPEVTFFHHESAICDDGRHQITRNGNTWRLTILRPMTGVDTGEYSCVAQNELGRDRCVCKCICGEPPERPSRPEVELSSDTEVFVSWEAPERLPVTLEGVVYRLECRPAGEKDAFSAWTVVSTCVEDEAVVVKHLIPLGIYQFRVTAHNEFGWGTPSITSRIIRCHPRGIPKLNLGVLRREGRHFTVVTMPQKTGRKGAGLTQIAEAFMEQREEEAMEEQEEGEQVGQVQSEAAETNGEENESNGNGNGKQRLVPLNTTEDPLKRFQLESELFRGQFSVIRYAVDSKTGAHCTVKIRAAPSHGSLMFATPVERMRAARMEHETLAECQSANVARLIAAYSSDSAFLLLFTERLYENLFQRFVRLESYTEEQIAFTVRQIASALRWIHFKGVAHLDVEPTNVMFSSKRAWLVKLVDFGRARRLGSKEGAAGDGQLIAEWTAPELILTRQNGTKTKNGGTNGGMPNAQSDIWGLGLCTFCLLAGFHPFADDDDSEQDIRRHVLEQRCDPNLIPVQASEEALRFVTWALKKDPGRRMRLDEALDHRFLASDAAMVRRRENIRYASHRLIRTAQRRLRHQTQFARNGAGGGEGTRPSASVDGAVRTARPTAAASNGTIGGTQSVPKRRIVSTEC